jgi:hypothetical protein
MSSTGGAVSSPPRYRDPEPLFRRQDVIRVVEGDIDLCEPGLPVPLLAFCTSI